MHFKETNAHSTPLFWNSNIMKLPDKIKVENCISISKYVNKKLPSNFDNWFTFSSTSHRYETSFADRDTLKVQAVRTTTYGKLSFINMAIQTWNNMQRLLKFSMLKKPSPNSLKTFLYKHFLSTYEETAI